MRRIALLYIECADQLLTNAGGELSNPKGSPAEASAALLNATCYIRRVQALLDTLLDDSLPDNLEITSQPVTSNE
jgi:hypothetical protein